MACGIPKATFLEMVAEEVETQGLMAAYIFNTHPDDREIFNLARVEGKAAHLNRKAIQSLVDHPEEARPIIRNLLRWAKEQGAK